MFSICFQSNQDLFTDMKKMKKIFIFPMPDLRPKASHQLVGVADYMDSGLEVNDNYTMHMYIKYMYNICTCTCDMTNLQT